MELYKAEALFLQQKYKECKQILQAINVTSDVPVRVEHVSLQSSMEQYPKKVVVHQNLLCLELISGNVETAKTILEGITTSLGITPSNGKEMPLCLLLSWIYYYIRVGDKKMALELVKRRRYLSNLFNAKGSMLKLTY